MADCGDVGHSEVNPQGEEREREDGWVKTQYLRVNCTFMSEYKQTNI